MNVFKSSSKKVAVLKQIKFLRKPIFETVYYKTIIPSVLYLIVIQGFCFSVLIDDIDRVHLLANRIIYNLPHDIHCDDIMNTLHWKFYNFILHQKTFSYYNVHGRKQARTTPQNSFNFGKHKTSLPHVILLYIS